MKGTTLAVTIGSDNTVEDLKVLIENKTNIPVHVQRLIFMGKQLEDGRRLSCYNGIQRESTIHLVKMWRAVKCRVERCLLHPQAFYYGMKWCASTPQTLVQAL